MATINFATRELTMKIVYFGARGAGCNTNVARLFGVVQGPHKSQLLKLSSEGESEHSWCFEFASPEPAPLAGFTRVFRVYSLPGGIGLGAHREEVVRGVDGVVFVADARRDRNDTNVGALLELEARLQKLGQELSNTPVLLQVNHTDAAEARPVTDVVFDLNPYGFPIVEAAANESRGVLETFSTIAARVVDGVAGALGGHPSAIFLTATHDPERATDLELVRAHVASIHASARTPDPAGDRVPDEPQVLEPESYEILDGPMVEVPFQPRELAGFHPVQVLGTTIDGDRVWVELAMERMGGGEVRRVAVLLQNRPPDVLDRPEITAERTDPHGGIGDAVSDAGRRSPRSPPKASPAARPITDYLPDTPTFAEAAPPTQDLSPVVYGVLGVGGGVVIGLLSAWLAWMS